MVIGIDHGYGYVKTKASIFGASVAKFDNQPPLLQRTVKYEGKYYTVGSIPEGLAGNKTLNDDYYILTLAGIAEELKARGNITTANVTVAGGLPLTRFGAEKEDFENYLLREKGKPIEFEYEGKKYSIRIEGSHIYPQGYAAIMPHLNTIKGPCIVVEIGTGTTEILFLDKDMIPDMKKAKTLQYGMTNCFSQVNEQINRVFSCELLPEQIIDMILGREVGTAPKAREICENALKEFAMDTFNVLNQNKVNYMLTPTYVLGGGATLLKKYASEQIKDTCMTLITDIKANAIGFEMLAANTKK